MRKVRTREQSSAASAVSSMPYMMTVTAVHGEEVVFRVCVEVSGMKGGGERNIVLSLVCTWGRW